MMTENSLSACTQIPMECRFWEQHMPVNQVGYIVAAKNVTDVPIKAGREVSLHCCCSVVCSLIDRLQRELQRLKTVPAGQLDTLQRCRRPSVPALPQFCAHCQNGGRAGTRDHVQASCQ